MEASMERVVQELRRVVDDAGALLEAGGESLGKARGAVASRLAHARDLLVDIEREAAYRGRRTAREVDRYAHEHPWQLTGIGLALGVALALAAWLIAESRRD